MKNLENLVSKLPKAEAVIRKRWPYFLASAVALDILTTYLCYYKPLNSNSIKEAVVYSSLGQIPNVISKALYLALGISVVDLAREKLRNGIDKTGLIHGSIPKALNYKLPIRNPLKKRKIDENY